MKLLQTVDHVTRMLEVRIGLANLFVWAVRGPETAVRIIRLESIFLDRIAQFLYPLKIVPQAVFIRASLAFTLPYVFAKRNPSQR